MFVSHSLRPSLGLVLTILCALSVRAAEPTADEILETTGVRGGFVVHLGCGNGGLTAGLRASDAFQVHGLDRDPATVARAREQLRTAGVYGPVAVDHLRDDRLPYVDNLVNLLVASDLGGVSRDEVLRVLVPNGVAYLRDQAGAWSKVVKPRPEDLDEWTHYLHDASGNPVAHDDVVGPPRHLQWVGSPRWSRHHDRMASTSAMVSTAGRIFYIMDTGSRISIQMPAKWQVIARDAFNGVVLWSRDIPVWHNHLWPLKSGPTQLTRRLVAVGDRVYVTLGIGAPLVCLDAATGETIQEYEGTKGTEEIVHVGRTLLLLVNEDEWELADFEAELNLGDQARIRENFAWNEKPRVVLAVDATSGRILWRRDTKCAPLTLSADGDRVYFHDGEKVVCVDRETGGELWASAPVQRKSFLTFNFGPRLVVYRSVLIFAGGNRTMTAFDVKTGKEVWTAPHAQSGYQSPEDLLVAGGLVWNAPTTSGKDTGVFTGRDPFTGEVKHEFPPDLETYWFHHRCYIAKATDKFLMPSRTGIEFVDTAEKNWDINHWVRGGCLYGVMPCNGLVYAPAHDCACYPEAKLYGLNALAPATPSRLPAEELSPADRLERGPAYGEAIEGTVAESDWPTYRHDHGRSGFSKGDVPAELAPTWTAKLGGTLTAPVIAGGRVFVAQTDAHTLHALDEKTGSTVWSFTTGGRIDSPPTIVGGRVLVGSADGSVYQLRAADGALVWRFLAATQDQRLMSFEQLESVWPVHGTILVRNDAAWFVSGRSNFLDGGLRLYRLDVETGEVLSRTDIDDVDPETGGDAQDRLAILQMQVGLNDVLSHDETHVYLKSQKFDDEGNRLDIGPVSGDFVEQGSAQRGEGVHLFAPMGFLDDEWFHRSYWVFGKSFAGGHAGYYQAGKFTPSGRILVADEDRVYGYGRKEQYYKWTTTLEHQLFAADREQPEIPAVADGPSMVAVPNSKSLDPTNSPLTVSAWVKTERPAGVILAHGGPARGYALVVEQGRPKFLVREAGAISQVAAPARIGGRWAHVAATLSKDLEMRIYVDGELAATAKAKALIAELPKQALQIGGDDGGAVGDDYRSPNAFTGTIDEVRIDHVALGENQVRELARAGKPGGAQPVLAMSFDDGKATDASASKNNGTATGTQIDQAGRVGSALQFSAQGGRASGSVVEHVWYRDVPLYARAMVLTGDTLFIAGPPDTIDEEATFERITQRDPTVQAELADQDAALEGRDGAVLWAVDKATGDQLGAVRLPSLPVWDGMAAAAGKLYVSAADGSVVCLEKAEE